MRLREAAVAAFADRGFHGTTTRDIAAAAAMSPAALYVHHRSKEDLLFEIALSGHRRTLEVVETASASSGDVAERLGRVSEDFVRHHALEHTTARIINYELASLSPEHRAEIEALRHVITERVVAVIREGEASGAFSPGDVRMSAAAILSLGVDLARWYDERGGWSADDLALHYRLLALRMVGAA